MRVYVCWDTSAHHPLLGDHPCGIADHAVVAGTKEIVAWAKANPAPSAS